MRWSNQYNRLEPTLGPQYFKTYAWKAPLESHWRRATCEEVNCEAMRNGFVMTIDLTTELGRKQFHYLTKVDKDRSHSLQRTGPFEVKLIYGPGNPCMKRAEHRIQIGKPPILLVHEGDWRGNPRRAAPYIHRYADDWTEDFMLHQQEIVDTIARG